MSDKVFGGGNPGDATSGPIDNTWDNLMQTVLGDTLESAKTKLIIQRCMDATTNVTGVFGFFNRGGAIEIIVGDSQNTQTIGKFDKPATLKEFTEKAYEILKG